MSRRILSTATIALIFIATISQAAVAQTIMWPNLDFPNAQTGWGCQFTNSCPTIPDVTRGNG